jgi:biotin transport system ATP-binding protein
VIEVSGVSQVYGAGAARRTVLDDVSITLSEHRIGVVGSNGSGKSTFARLLNGLVEPTRGTVSVDGLDTVREGKQVRQKVGFCFTDPASQIVMPTVREDVAFGLRRKGLRGAAADPVVDAALERFGLTSLADSAAHTLSGGEKQLLALCSVLVTEPDILVLDEPTTLLDLRNAKRIGEAVEALPQQVLLVTHQLELLASFDRVVVFDDGRIVCDDVPSVAVAHYRALMA